ncbi:MAG: hypothetical protein AAB883_02415 [Patescibacteria group bacterium]
MKKKIEHGSLKDLGIWVLITLLVVILGGFWLLNNYIYQEKQGDGSTSPYFATLSGTETCLPHKDTDGPQTKECARGFKTEVGEYYVLEFKTRGGAPFIPSGATFSAHGVVTPAEHLSTDKWSKYAIAGVFTVKDSVVVDESTVTPLEPTATPIGNAVGDCYIGGCSHQICSGEPNMASTCEYSEVYACYQTATCQRQATGKCGWTETPGLTACIAAKK